MLRKLNVICFDGGSVTERVAWASVEAKEPVKNHVVNAIVIQVDETVE
jgi:hypothetical protein